MRKTESLRIVVADDEAVVRDMIGGFLQKLGHTVCLCADGREALERIREMEADIVISDIRMPDLDGLALLRETGDISPVTAVIMISAYATTESAIEALRLGAADFLLKPVKLEELAATLPKAARISAMRRETRRLRSALDSIQHRAGPAEPSAHFVGESAALAEVEKTLRLGANSGMSDVLVTGETGTGKEVAARLFHACARPAGSPFIAMNCPALPESLIESELFGHVRGAFTGARDDRLGAFELAEGGTLFLDEIGDLTASGQAKLLRALETRVVRRVGSQREVAVDVRVVAATNDDLERRVRDRSFRADLFYRLNRLHVRIPPLRERREDILPLARHFLHQYRANRDGRLPGFSPAVTQLLFSYPYPGNVRELRSIIERAAMLAEGGTIREEHLTLPSHQPDLLASSPEPDLPPEARRVLDALEANQWNRRRAAGELGITYDAILWRIQKFQLAK